MHTHVRVCTCEFAAHTQISSEILSILVLMSWNIFKKKKIKQLRAWLVGWDGDIPPYVVQQSLSKMPCVPLFPFWPKLDVGGGTLTTAGACCGQHTANAGAAACCGVPVMLCKLQA